MHGPHRGFTLYELLLTLAVAAVATSLSVSWFGVLAARQAQTTELNALFGAVHLARKESILRRRVVSLCPSVDFSQCADSRDWSTGWIMFENRDRDSPPRVDAGERILKTHQVLENVRISANRRGFTLRATFLRATNGTLVACDRQERTSPKALVISYTGRPRVAVHTPDGEPYSCAD